MVFNNYLLFKTKTRSNYFWVSGMVQGHKKIFSEPLQTTECPKIYENLYGICLSIIDLRYT